MSQAEIIAASDADALERAAGVIRGGGVVAVPTETFYGLAADATHQMATARIFEIKGRPAKLQLPLMAASLQQVTDVFGALDDATARAARAFWPGPLSLVLASVPLLATKEPTVALRVPAHEFARALAERSGTFLTSTSANRSGDAPAETAGAVLASLGGLVDLIVDGGPTSGGRPSTIADLRGDVPRLIRDGAIAWSRVLESLQ